MAIRAFCALCAHNIGLRPANLQLRGQPIRTLVLVLNLLAMISSRERLDVEIIQTLEGYAINKTLRPIIVAARNLFNIRFADIYVYCIVISLILVVPTGLEITSMEGPVTQFTLSLILVGLVAYFALVRSPLKASPPLWRAFLWLMILRNCFAISEKEFRPYSLLMWSFLLISQYVCLIDANYKNEKNR